MSQLKHICFTWNNFDNGVQPFIEKFASEHCEYLCYGKEIGDSGTPHLQGFFTLLKRKRIASIRKLGMECHMEKMKGTIQQAVDYCKKDGDFIEHGTQPVTQQGKRTDLETACDRLKEGASIHTLAEEMPSTMVKYGRGLRELKLLLEKPYNHDSCRGIWYYGPPGSGKSYRARVECPTAYLKAQNKWWDGYAGEHDVILDDLDTHQLGHHLKIWADRYACTGETKGGTISLQHRRFVVTSNYSPSELFDNADPTGHMSSAIERRFDVIFVPKLPRLNDVVDGVALAPGMNLPE